MASIVHVKFDYITSLLEEELLENGSDAPPPMTGSRDGNKDHLFGGVVTIERREKKWSERLRAGADKSDRCDSHAAAGEMRGLAGGRVRGTVTSIDDDVGSGTATAIDERLLDQLV